MGNHEDNEILKEIPNRDLEKLAKMYEEYKEDYPYIYSTIKIGIKWKNKNPNNAKVIFLSPNQCWTKDGTFLAIFTFTVEVDVVLCTLEESMKNLYNGIRYTKRKQFNQEMNFYATHDKFTELVKKACEERNMKNTLWIKGVMVRLPLDIAKNLKIDYPSDVHLKPLEIKDIPKINSVWPRKYDGSEIKLANLIEMNGGIGAYSRDNDELVAWVICDQMGQIAVLQTDDKFKKRGYGSLVTKAISKKIAQTDVYPFAGINVKNTASLKMFSKIGFQEFGSDTYFYMAPKLNSKL